MDDRSQNPYRPMADAIDFDLNGAIKRWRENLGLSPRFRAENIEELEVHLRDSVASLEGRGLSAEESFWVASRRLGGAGQLSEEFGKLNPGLIWRARAFWALFGVLLYLAVANLARAVSAGAIFAGSYFATDGLSLGWCAVGCKIAVILLAVWWIWYLIEHGSNSAGATTAPGIWSRKTWLLGLLAVILVSKIANAVLVVVGIKRLSAVTMGETLMVGQWLNLIGPLAVLVALGFACARLRPRKSSAGGQQWLLLFLVAACTAFAAGCGQKPETGSPTGAVAASHDQTMLEHGMTLWTAGKKDEAVEKFMSVDWTAGQLFSTGSILNYSEAQFVALPQAAREKLGKHLADELDTLKAICSRVNALGQEAQAKGDKTQARKYFVQVQRCGEALDKPDRTRLTQLVGQALKRLSAKQLAGLRD